MTSCMENSLDSTCVCNPVIGNSKDSKVYDYVTQRYYCCGNIPFTVTGDSVDQLIKSIPESSTSYCISWWKEAQEDKNISYILERQDHISSTMTPANVTDNKIVCPEGRVIRWAKFPNPNKIGEQISTLVCTSVGTELGSNPDFKQSEATTYFVKGCDKNVNVCTTDISNVTSILIGNNGTDAGESSIDKLLPILHHEGFIPIIISLILFLVCVVIMVIYLLRPRNYLLQNNF